MSFSLSNKMTEDDSKNSQPSKDYQKANLRYQGRLRWPKPETKKRVNKNKLKSRLTGYNEKELLPRQLRMETQEGESKAYVKMEEEKQDPSEDESGSSFDEEEENSSAPENSVAGPKPRYHATTARNGPQNGPLEKGQDGLYHCNYEDCKKSFQSHARLETHSNIHTRRMTYQCGECWMEYDQRPNLIRHLKVHTGETLYKCSECLKEYKHRRSLLKHLITHTSKIS